MPWGLGIVFTIYSYLHFLFLLFLRIFFLLLTVLSIGFCLVSLLYGISYLEGYPLPKTSLKNNCSGTILLTTLDKKFHASPTGISPKVIARLEFELFYSDITVKYVRHYTTVSLRLKQIRILFKLVYSTEIDTTIMNQSETGSKVHGTVLQSQKIAKTEVSESDTVLCHAHDSSFLGACPSLRGTVSLFLALQSGSFFL